MDVQQLVETVERAVQRLRRPPSRRTQRWLMVIAGIGLFLGSIFAVRSLDVDITRIRWIPLLVAALLGVPFTAAVNGLEFATSARLVGRRVGPLAAMRVSVLSTAANLLPVPGAAIVRIQYLKQSGASYLDSTSATVVMAATWIGLSTLVAGTWLLASVSLLKGLGFLAAAIACGVIVVVFVRLRLTPGRLPIGLLARVVIVESASVFLAVLRLYLILIALRVPSAASGAALIAVSGPLASSAGFLPGGLGLREAIAVPLGLLTGLSAAQGFTAAVLDRVIGLLVHIPIAIVVSRGRSPESPGEVAGRASGQAMDCPRAVGRAGPGRTDRAEDT